MSDSTETSFSNKAKILADLWLNNSEDENLEDFFEHNDLGLPLAYAVAEDIVQSTEKAQALIEETFAGLLTTLEIEDDCFDSLDELFEFAEASKNLLDQ
jgi:hypothetical protein